MRALGVAVLAMAVLGLCVGGCARGSNDTIASFADASPQRQSAITCGLDGALLSAAASGAPGESTDNEAGVTSAANGDDAGDAADAGDDAPNGADATSGDDSQTGDDAASSDASASAAPGASLAASPQPGDLAITEIMLAPSGPEPDSEWFEVYNLSASPKLLSGVTIKDGFADTHVIASNPPIVLPPFTYAVLARSRAAALQQLIPASCIAYEYGGALQGTQGIALDEGDAGDLSLWLGSTSLVDVPYGMWNARFVGQSIELAIPQSDPTDPTDWCLAETPWASGSDDGTPGQPNDCGP